LIAERISSLIDLQSSISASDSSFISFIWAEKLGSRIGFTVLIHSSWLLLNSYLLQDRDKIHIV
jgi:hypothetical protein